MRTQWDDHQERTLREMHAAGHSATQIGVHIGFSRSAVLGKVFRLGLSSARRTSVSLVSCETRQVLRSAGLVPLVPSPGPVSSPCMVPALRQKPALSPELAPPLNLCIDDLRAILPATVNQCRWICEDGSDGHDGEAYCGHATQPGASWCPGHAAKLLVAPPRPVKQKQHHERTLSWA